MEGQLDDYAFYCWALLELYEANFSTSCLREAVKLALSHRLSVILGGAGSGKTTLIRALAEHRPVKVLVWSCAHQRARRPAI